MIWGAIQEYALRQFIIFHFQELDVEAVNVYYLTSFRHN